MQGITQQWCTIQSDPGIFIQDNAQMLNEFRSIYRINIKNWSKRHTSRVIILTRSTRAAKNLVKQTNPIAQSYNTLDQFMGQFSSLNGKPLPNLESLFFANQVLTNSCATQAILSILLNNFQIDIGDTLSGLKAFTIDMDPKQKGQTIGNSDQIRQAHNSFSKQQYFSIYEKRAAKEDDNVFHFISYIPYEGKLYELDGLQKGPIELGDIQNGNWLQLAQTCIQERIKKYAAEEIRFNLMAVVGNQIQKFQKLAAASYCKIQYAKKLLDQEVDEASYAALSQSEISSIPAQIELLDGNEYSEIISHFTIAEEKKLAGMKAIKMLIYLHKMDINNILQIENVRRKHNYIPLAFQFLKALAKTGQLHNMLKDACQQEQKSKKK